MIQFSDGHVACRSDVHIDDETTIEARSHNGSNWVWVGSMICGFAIHARPAECSRLIEALEELRDRQRDQEMEQLRSIVERVLPTKPVLEKHTNRVEL